MNESISMQLRCVMHRPDYGNTLRMFSTRWHCSTSIQPVSILGSVAPPSAQKNTLLTVKSLQNSAHQLSTLHLDKSMNFVLSINLICMKAHDELHIFTT